MNLFAKKHAALESYTYSRGGGMEGAHHFIKIGKVDEETALVIYSDQNWHYENPQIAEYYVPIATLMKIEKIYDSYRMYRYRHLPDSKFQILDGDTSSYHFWFEDNKSLSVSESQQIPKKAYDGFGKIKGIIEAATSAVQKLPGLVPDVITEEERISRTVEGELRILVTEYSNNHLRYSIANGLEETVEIEDRIDVFKIVDEERISVFHKEGSREYEVYADYCHCESVQLKEKRLEIGRYVLSIDGHEAEFEIQ